MEMKVCAALGVFVACGLFASSFAVPVADKSDLTRDRRSMPDLPKPESKDMDVFKQLVLMSLQGLVEDGAVNPDIILPEEQPSANKRARYIGWCAKKSARKGVMYFPCYKNKSTRKMGVGR